MEPGEVNERFSAQGLREADLAPEPIQQFRIWFETAVNAGLRLPDAATLATATADGRPSARLVLLKAFDERGFVFFTNYESRKAEELAANPRAALVVYWKELDRQVRVEGTVERVTPAESDAYFRSRPWKSRVSACASPQSRVIPDRAFLERRAEELLAVCPEEEIPRPAFWGGYRVVPAVIEFWQGRPNRLHDRLCYRRQADGRWRVERLAP